MIKLGTICATKDNTGNVWFSNFFLNGLFKFDCRKGEFDFIHKFEYFNSFQYGFHGSITCCEDEIIVFPYFSNDICIYSISKDIESVVPIPGKKGKYYLTFVFNDCGWLLSDKKEVICFDCIKKTFTSSDTISKWIISKIDGKAKVSLTMNENILVIKTSDSNMFCYYDLLNNVDGEIYIEKSPQIVDRVVFAGDMFWVLYKDTMSVQSYSLGGEKRDYVGEDNQFSFGRSSCPYSSVVYYNNNYLILNHHSNNIMIVDSENSRLTKFYDCGGECLDDIKKNDSAYLSSIIIDGKLLILPNRAKKYYILSNNETSEQGTFAICQSNCKNFEKFIDYIMSNEIVYEDRESIGLETFIEELLK